MENCANTNELVSWQVKKSSRYRDEATKADDVVKDDIAKSTCDWDKIPTSTMEGKVQDI